MALATKHLVRFLILVIQAFSYLILILKLPRYVARSENLGGELYVGAKNLGPPASPLPTLAKSEVLRELSQLTFAFLGIFDHILTCHCLHFYCNKFSILLTTYPPLNANVMGEGSPSQRLLNRWTVH